MTEQIGFDLDAEYTKRVAEHPELVEIDFSTYAEFELDAEDEAGVAEQRERNERDIQESELTID